MSRGCDSADSYTDIYLRYRDPVFRYVRRVTRNEAVAEDLTQDVFFLAFQKWEILTVHPNVPGFLMLSASNLIKKWYHKQGREQTDEDEVLAALAGDEEMSEEISEFGLVDLYQSVETILSKEELDILRYYYEYGYSASEMARLLGITETCFKVRVKRMRDKLRQNLQVLCIVGILTEKWEMKVILILIR